MGSEFLNIFANYIPPIDYNGNFVCPECFGTESCKNSWLVHLIIHHHMGCKDLFEVMKPEHERVLDKAIEAMDKAEELEEIREKIIQLTDVWKKKLIDDDTYFVTLDILRNELSSK
ncbi:unnamed protein product [Rotaria sordida]|uniref:Uncharacterized protein n=1 Tax=Rotaria sordida TaxID=392033 RepID=A0A815HCE5_9BILA|nr:unnamed protein product [Rotaria sordida]CAF4101161.1 unnamed protein product [Rotaria sordida]